MSPTCSIQQIIDSPRWVSFLESIGVGLELNLSLITEVELLLSVPEICPNCGNSYVRLSPAEITAISNSYTGNAGLTREAICSSIVIVLRDGLSLVIRSCPNCTGTRILPSLQQRAEIAGKLVRDFQVALIDAFINGQINIKLSALRQINQIILSLFRGENNALNKACDLILSVLIIILDAPGSWLEYQSDFNHDLLIKGDREAIEGYLNSQSNHEAKVSWLDLKGGNVTGRLGVYQPNDQEQAETLLALLVQECIIVFEIEKLFRLIQADISDLLEVFHSAILLIDSNYSIYFANRPAEMLFEKDAISLIGSSALELKTPWTLYLQDKIKSQASGKKSFFAQGPNERLLDWQVIPLKDQILFKGWLIIADDRTDFYHWQELGRQAEYFSTITSLIGPLAHELRNPLSAAKGLLQLANRKRNSDKVSGYIDLILHEVERMNFLINEFLQLGRTVHLNLEPLDPVIFLQEIKPLLDGETAGTKVKIIMDLKPVPRIEVDSRQWTQVILNLVRNGIEAMEGKGVIEISLRKTADWVKLTVRDHGPGLEPKALDKLFQPFVTFKQRGTGLGLSICKALIENHRGRISGTNHPGGGAIFTILLPVQGTAPNEQQMVDVILAISDETILYSIEQVLQTSGFLQINCLNQTDLPAKIAHLLPVAVILDQLPPVELIKEISSSIPHLKIILIEKPPFHQATQGVQLMPFPLDYARLVEEIRIAKEEQLLMR